ncbi:MAG TPA: hypothetical protein VM779_07670 [Thermoanaerobaculia bacterium]|nr:hypothetical protein [Thermoanaerobaculia bacterium]
MKAWACGIEWVIVNGELVVDGEAVTKARPGTILRGHRGAP